MKHQPGDAASSIQPEKPRLLDLRAASSHLGLSYWTLYQLAQCGAIPVVRIPDPRQPGRYQRRIWFSRETLDRFISQNETSAIQESKKILRMKKCN
jgi:predicted DNA-binding transcriptional regulator AlpA